MQDFFIGKIGTLLWGIKEDLNGAIWYVHGLEKSAFLILHRFIYRVSAVLISIPAGILVAINKLILKSIMKIAADLEEQKPFLKRRKLDKTIWFHGVL